MHIDETNNEMKENRIESHKLPRHSDIAQFSGSIAKSITAISGTRCNASAATVPHWRQTQVLAVLMNAHEDMVGLMRTGHLVIHIFLEINSARDF